MPSLLQLEPHMSESTAIADTLSTDNSGTVRNWALWFAAALVFVRFSMLNEVIAHLTGLHLYLLYVIGLPAILAVFAKKGLRDTLRKAPALFWLGFGLWLVIATPWSIWKGGSTHAFVNYFRSELMMQALAAAAVVSLAVSRLFASTADTRLDLEFGTVANANDFAAHLLLVL